MAGVLDQWFEYDCPVQGIDFDVRPVPVYGAMISCSACGGQHRADETLGVVWVEAGGIMQDVTSEWIAGR